MKRFACLTLAAALLFTHCYESQAPVPVYLGLMIKCVATGTIGATGLIIYRCEPDYYLIRVENDGEDTYWLTSQASKHTVAKNQGWTRCEGPWKSREEPDFRAWVNNKTPDFPMFPCGPLGVIPGPTRTNWIAVTLEQDTGAGFASIASVTLPPDDDNFSFVMLSTGGTNGMSQEQILKVQGADVVVTSAVAASGIIRTRYEEAPQP